MGYRSAERMARGHAYPLNSAQTSLRRRIVQETGRKPHVAQRLKERPSIIAKLQRGAPRMQLSTMQDIAGCRGVLRSIGEVERIVRRFRTSGSRKSTVVEIDDYIRSPATSGYRGIHLITEYYDRPNDSKSSSKSNSERSSSMTGQSRSKTWDVSTATLSSRVKVRPRSSTTCGSPHRCWKPRR